jgi:hypothetical protein
MILLEWAIVIACAFVLWRRGIPLWSKKSLVLIGLAQGIWAIFFCARMGR